MSSAQLGLFGREAPLPDPHFATLRRTELDPGAWIDYAPGWLTGHEIVFETLRATTAWHVGREHLYDRVLPTPRLVAVLPDDGPGHPALETMRALLSERYREALTRTSLGLYRDGRDSVAWHGDRVARRMQTALVATVSVGAPRRFRVRPYGGGRSLITFELGWGDLLVMGGSCQRCFQHSVPKVARAAPRIAIMFRPDWAAGYTTRARSRA